MSIVVQKFGGTSVASVTHIERVASRILKTRSEGHSVVVVVSAMGDETDRLDGLAREVDYAHQEARREIDVLLSSGEQVTISLLSMTLMKMGCRAKSYTGSQIRILTDSAYTRARIREVDTSKLQADIDAGVVPVNCNFLRGVYANANLVAFDPKHGHSDIVSDH